MKKISIVLSLFLVLHTGLVAQNSVLSSGLWHKVRIEKNGVYKIDFTFLQNIGLNPGSIDPRKIKVYGHRSGMLPQANSVARINDLEELAIQVVGEQDGTFNTSDYILFYSEGADKVFWDASRKIFNYQNHLYDDFNYYFITVGDSDGKRIATANSVAGDYPEVNEFEDYIFHELEEYNELESGRIWYGERFDNTTEYSFANPIAGLITSEPVKLVSDVMAQSFVAPSFTVSVNNVIIEQQNIGSIPNSKYGVKGLHNTDTISFNTSVQNLDVKYKYNKASSGKSIGFLNFFLMNFKRTLSLYNQQTIFQSDESTLQPVSKFILSQTEPTSTIWNISDVLNPVIQSTTTENNSVFFNTETDIVKQFIAFSPSVPSPEYVGPVTNQNLHGLPVPDLVIITNNGFKAEALRLAEHRKNVNGLAVSVVTPEEIYNEFSGGKQDVTAIRDFIKYLYDKNPSKLKSILLFGKGSYDYKNRVSNNTNFVPTYESRNSLDPLKSYSSDDYYSFLEDSEGNWSESPAEDHTSDIGIGRLPVKSLAEAKTVVDKLIDYDTKFNRFGKWKREIVFFADDGNNDDGFSNEHHQQARDLADYLDGQNPEVTTRRMLMGAYPKISKPSGDLSPDLDKEFINAFNNGSLIINYTGHGAEKILADEKILNEGVIASLTNDHYPLLITATCAFGRNDNPALVSGAEQSIIQSQGGTIGLVTSTRDVFSSTNFDLNQAFYQALLQKKDSAYLSLGEIFRRTKNNSINGVFNRNFYLLADPSMMLAFPRLSAIITEMKTANNSDTLKALSTVIVKGEIRDESDQLADFDGEVLADVFDKKSTLKTLGERNSPITYQQWTNTLFRGKATVENGLFEFEFIVPKNINYLEGVGRISLYAKSNAIDAWGSSEEFKVGGSEENVVQDNTSPTMRLYLGDTTFINGGIISGSTNLLGFLEDDQGINISGYGIGNSLQVILDGTEVFIVNDYYESGTDTYKKGILDFPMTDLSTGRHTLIVKAWDTHNNPAEASLDFTVSDGNDIAIQSSGVYPNPTESEATFFFAHSRPGDDLGGSLSIYDITGQVVQQNDFTIFESPYRVEVAKVNSFAPGSKKLQKGLYFARLEVRSLSNGSKSEHVSKLIITN
ncbi:MAG: type IX secretion system sortase PorU [Flammeovirgaceae bacterium]|nr:type IX secretion system sortase PorU [Flammeovirgaceae bacterium]